MTVVPRPWRFAGWFLAALVLIAAGGAAYEYRQLGASDAQAAGLVARDVGQQFAALTERLDRTANAVAAKRELIVAATGDAREVPALFEAVRQAAGDDVSITVYTSDAKPLAWTGRPSDLPRATVTGPVALMVAPGASGPRLFKLQPVADGTPDGTRRVATVVSECSLPLD